MIQITSGKISVVSEEMNCTYGLGRCYLTQRCSSLYKPECTLCHVSLEKLWSKLQCSQNLSQSFQAYYSTTPTSMTQNSSIMLNCCSTVLNNELSMWSTQCATASESTLRPMSGCRWNDTVSLVCPTAFMSTRCEDVLQFATRLPITPYSRLLLPLHSCRRNCSEHN